MEVLAGKLGEGIYLSPEYLAQSWVLVPETGSGVPHLKIKVRGVRAIVKETPFASSEYFRRFGIVDRVSMGTIDGIFSDQFLIVNHSRPSLSRGGSGSSVMSDDPFASFDF